MKKQFNIKAINEKIKLVQASFTSPIEKEGEYFQGKYSGMIDALLWVKRTFK